MIWPLNREGSGKIGIARRALVGVGVLSVASAISGCPAGHGSSQAGFADRSQHFEQQSAGDFGARSPRGSRLTEKFNRFDRNSDGAISSEELDRPALFRRLDQNNDGLITLEEARNNIRNRKAAHRNNASVNDSGNPVNSAPSAMESDVGADAASDDGENPRQFGRRRSGGEFPDAASDDGENPRQFGRRRSGGEFPDAAADDGENPRQFGRRGIGGEFPNRDRGNRLTERFNKFDKNGDGVLAPDEVNRPELFQRLDQNSDGLATLEEARAYRSSRRQLAYNATGTTTDAAPLAQPITADARPYRDRGARSLSAPDGDFKQYPNIRYADVPGVDPNLLSLDIYAPKTGQDHPVILMIHGGGWQRGDKAKANVVANKARYFTEKGHVFVSINYRLAPAVRHPVPAQDVARAIAWTRNNIGRYQGDPERIYLMGHSAGAHLAALVATDQRYLQGVQQSPRSLKGIILLDGAGYDIPKLMREHNQPRIYTAAFGDDERVWRDASPITHIAKGKPIPPFLIFYTPRPRAQMLSEQLSKSLTSAGVSVRSKMINASHKQINQDVGNPDGEATRAIMEFLSQR